MTDEITLGIYCGLCNFCCRWCGVTVLFNNNRQMNDS